MLNYTPSSKGVRRKFLLCDLRPHNIDALFYYLGTYDWSNVLSCDDIQGAYDQLSEVVKLHMQMCIPVKVVRVGKRDPT
jgi:hypothetical protein